MVIDYAYLRSKVSGGNDENSTTSLGDLGRALTFEKNDDAGKLRLVLSDVLSLVNEVFQSICELIFFIDVKFGV